MKYVVLLRGVNVGGNRRVPMAALRSVFEGAGFRDTTTYINSGNVVITSDEEPDRTYISHILSDAFGFEVPFLLLSAADIIAIADAIPADWRNDRTEYKADVVYLFDDVNLLDILERIRPRLEFEDLHYVNHAILSRVARKHQSKSSLLKLIGTDLYRSVTIRNVTTARKLAEMVQ